MKIVLFQPKIPQNTGNIIRTCDAGGASLILVKPLGFSTANRQMKRAGLDYFTDIEELDNLEMYLASCPSFYFFSSKAKKSYTEASYEENTHLIFGSETDGLPPHFFDKWPECFLTIPMEKNTRCLNLSNAAAIALFEARRQLLTKNKR